MGIGDNPMGGSRRSGSSSGRPMSTDATLASIEMQLFSHGQLIEKLVTKMDDIGGLVMGMTNEMEHLVTKESCAEGRKDLSDDLKARMDGDREITGMNITLPALLQQYTRTDKPTPVQPKSQASTHPSGHPKEPKSVIYYIKAISAIVSLTFALFTMTFFAFKMIARLDEQQRVMHEQQQVMRVIQRDLEHMDAGRSDTLMLPRTVVMPEKALSPQDDP